MRLVVVTCVKAMINNTLKLIKMALCLSTSVGFNFSYIDSALSQSATFLFQTTVEGRCEFKNMTGGSLGLSSDRKKIDSKMGGSAGSATFECNQPAKLKVETPQQLAGPTLNTTLKETQVLLNGNSCNTGKNNQSFNELIKATNPAVPTESSTPSDQLIGCHGITVNMNLSNPTEIATGTYIFSVRVTATQN